MNQPANDLPLNTSTRRAYAGRFLNVDLETFANPAGSEITLELIRHPGASAIVPLLSGGHDPEVLMLRQFRYAAGGLIWEIPAGVLDAGEDPEACARRELREETGATAGNLERLTTIYTTPGFTDERIHLFLASDLTITEVDHQYDEFIEVTPRRISDLMRMIKGGEIMDGKTIVSLMYVAGFHLGL